MAWRLNTKRKFRFGVFLLLVVVSAIAIFLLHPQKQQLIYTKESNYAIHARQSFNQPQYYPIEQTLPSYYQPIANWVGRLILPDVQQMRSGADWVWLEV
jgi:predicted Abi (CAAX) family protease